MFVKPSERYKEIIDKIHDYLEKENLSFLDFFKEYNSYSAKK